MIAGSCRNKGIIFIDKACSKFYIRKRTKNCLKIKNSHKIIIGSTAAFSFFITTNLIRAPATKIAIISFTNQASGKIFESTTIIIIEHSVERSQISQTL